MSPQKITKQYTQVITPHGKRSAPLGIKLLIEGDFQKLPREYQEKALTTYIEHEGKHFLEIAAESGITQTIPKNSLTPQVLKTRNSEGKPLLQVILETDNEIDPLKAFPLKSLISLEKTILQILTEPDKNLSQICRAILSKIKEEKKRNHLPTGINL